MRVLTLSIALALLPLAGCAANAPAAVVSDSERSLWAAPVKPSANLYRVDPLLYRSKQPQAQDIADIRALGIKSIIDMRLSDRQDRELLQDQQDLTLFSRPLHTENITPEQVADILYLIERQQQTQTPVLVHCQHGADRTGLIVAMYRIIRQGWSIEAAKTEMQQGPYGYHSMWQNIDHMFNPQTIGQIKAEYARLKSSAAVPTQP